MTRYIFDINDVYISTITLYSILILMIPYILASSYQSGCPFWMNVFILYSMNRQLPKLATPLLNFKNIVCIWQHNNKHEPADPGNISTISQIIPFRCYFDLFICNKTECQGDPRLTWWCQMFHLISLPHLSFIPCISCCFIIRKLANVVISSPGCPLKSRHPLFPYG